MRINEYEKFVFDFSFSVYVPAYSPKIRLFLNLLCSWSSWDTYRVHINDTLIIRQADTIVQGLKKWAIPMGI